MKVHLFESFAGECLLLFLCLSLSRSLSLRRSLSLSAFGLLLLLRCFSFLESFGDLLLFLSRTFSLERLSLSLSRLGDFDLAIFRRDRAIERRDQQRLTEAARLPKP